MGIPKAVAAFMEEYGVLSDEIWPVPGGKSYAVKHSALERIAVEKAISFEKPAILQNDAEFKSVAICVTGSMNGLTLWSIGEASPANCKNSYMWAMAEKRARDRVILKLLAVHGAVYSEDEAEDFKKRANPHVNEPKDISDGKVKTDPETGEIIDNIPDAEGVTPKPKKNSRQLYADLEKEMQSFETAAGLLGWAKTIAKDAATLPEDWRETLRRRTAEQLETLRTQEAAE